MCTRMTSDGVGRFSLAQGATRDLVVVAVLLCGLAGTGPAAAQSYANLDEAVTKLASRLASSDRLAGKQLLVNAHDFFEERSGSILPLSATLRERFTTELSSRGLAVFSLPEGSEDDMVILQGVWRVLSNPGATPARLHLTVRATERTQGGHRTQSADGRVEGVDARLLTPDLDSWGRHAVKKLEDRVRDRRHRAIHVGSFDVRGEVNEPEIVREDLEAFWLEPAFAESRLFRLVSAPAGGGNDGALNVRARFGRDQVIFSFKVEDDQGGQVTSATVKMAREVLGDILDVVVEPPPPGPRVFILTRQRLSGNEDPREWAAGQRVAIGPMGTDIRRNNVVRYLEALGMSPVVIARPEIAPAIEKGVIDGVVTVDDRLVGEVWPLYTGPPAELRSRSDFNESGDVVVVANP